MISAIARMAPRTRFIVSLVIAVLAGGALFAQGFMPQVQALKAEQNKQKQLEPNIKLKKLKLEKLKPELTEPMPITDAQRDALLGNNTSLYDEQSRIAFISSLPDIARSSNLRGFTLKPLESGDGELVIVRPDKDKPKEIIKARKKLVRVSFRGEFPDIMNFFERLRDRGSYMKLSTIKMTANRRSGGLNVDMSFHLYCEETAQK